MALDRLRLEGVRNLAPVELEPASGLNWLLGENGAGKTSVIEAVYLLGRGRSFRAGRPATVIQHGQAQLRVVGHRADGLVLGIERGSEGWRGRIGGRDCQRISEFAAALPLVLFEPDSHRLIDGGPERRRQYLDWQLFHVEPDYLTAWQRYARLLRQRNAALKARAAPAMLEALEGPLVPAARVLDQQRRQQVDAVGVAARSLLSELGVRLPGNLSCDYRRGYPEDQSLAEALKTQRESDLDRGFTQRGPHRADIILKIDGQNAAHELSRGQQKLLTLVLLLAQLALLNRSAARSPILLLDDPVSELDQRHLGTVVDWLIQQPFQSWVTATAPPSVKARMFHVKQGQIALDD